MATAVSIEHVSKTYRLGVIGSGTLTADVGRWWARLRGKPDPSLKIGEEPHERQVGQMFWALDDVSIDVQEGEVLGVIGRNGAGKSTLLKLLSQVTAPSSGRIQLRGRVASLLEVGTGFHPELTGRENVFLNGAILGMTRHEIRRNFDEIVAFSECEAFIDTPVKRYSSGMYVRLAFAVAAHLESEILIVDEVLAVGDAQFQKKCLGKMRDVSSHGRTILFVSHSMAAVSALCSRAMLLKGGRLALHGETECVVAEYQRDRGVHASDGVRDLSNDSRQGNGQGRFVLLQTRAVDNQGKQLSAPETGCDLVIDVELESISPLREANVAVIVYDSTGYRVIDVNTALKEDFLSLDPGERATVRFHVRDLLLKPGEYTVGVWLGRGVIETIDYIENAAMLVVRQAPSSVRHPVTFPGVYQCRFSHTITREGTSFVGEPAVTDAVALSEHS